jgi:hypothetical protein
MRRVLCLRGLVTEEQMAEAEQLRADTGQRLGDILLRQFSLADTKWQELVELEIGEALYRLFRWREGTYRFEAKEALDPTEGRIAPRTVEAFLMEGVRRIDEWPLIEQNLPQIDGVAYRVAAEEGAEPSDLGTNEGRILELVDGRTRMADMVDASGLGEFEASKALASLMAAGLVSVRPERVEPSAAPAPKAAAAWRRAAPLWAFAAVWLALNLAVFRPWQVFRPSTAEPGLPEQIQARADRATLAVQLDQYYAETGSFPPTLEVLVRRRMVEPSLLKDPWSRPYRYEPQENRYLLEIGRPAVSRGGGAASRDAGAR